MVNCGKQKEYLQGEWESEKDIHRNDNSNYAVVNWLQ